MYGAISRHIELLSSIFKDTERRFLRQLSFL